MIDAQLKERLIRAALHRALMDRVEPVTLTPEDLGTVDFQLAIYPKDNPPRVIVGLMTRERFDELGKQGVPIL